MKQSRKLLSLLLVLCLIFSLTCTVFAVEGAPAELAGKTVILHTNDVHGAVLGYAKAAQLKADYAAKGADVILVDCGDYSQGAPEVSISKGGNAIAMMNTAGYDYVTLGNHEFDYGYDNLVSILKDAKFQLLCADVTKDGKAAFTGHAVVEKGGVKIGLFGLDTPESLTKVNPALIQGVNFPQEKELYACAQAEIDALKADGADLIVCLSHLGIDAESAPNRSIDVYNNTKGIDVMLDGHSHTVMTPGVEKIQTGVNVDKETGAETPVFVENPCKDLPIQSTGTKFAYVGVVVIDNAKKAIEKYELVPAADIQDDAAVLAAGQKIVDDVNATYGAKFAESRVALNGDKAPGNRTEETNLGDLITDAMLWSVLKDPDALLVNEENVICITNGGGIRAPIAVGDITMKDINTVLPFGNTVAVVYVTGAELLEALEASTYCTPTAIGGFPQVSGIRFTVATDVEFDQGEQYPDSTYYAPKSINRVTILDVNDQEFDPEAVYAVVTNNFCAAGGDTYYAFKNASSQFDTSIPMDEAVMAYIDEVLEGVVGEMYSEPMGRILVGTQDELALAKLKQDAYRLLEGLLPKEAYVLNTAKAVDKAGHDVAAADTLKDAEAAFKALETAIAALKVKDNTFKDVAANAWYDPAVDFVAAVDLMNGTGDNLFQPESTMTRAMVVTVLYRLAGSPDVKDLKCDFKDLTQDWYKNAVIWAANHRITNGTSATTFEPNTIITREQMAAMLARFLLGEVGAPPEGAELTALKEELALLYADGASVSAFAALPVLRMSEMEIMQGGGAEGDNLPAFRPQGQMMRSECAQVLLNVYRALPGWWFDSELPAA